MLTDGDFVCRVICFPGDINGVLRIDEAGFGNIYINDSLSPMAKRKAFEHEFNHLKNDDMFNELPLKIIES